MKMDFVSFHVRMARMLSLAIVALSGVLVPVACDTIVVDWNSVVRPLSTRPALQVVVNPLVTRDCPLSPTIFNLLNQLGANDVRFVPWLPYPRLGVAELEPPSGAALCGFLSGSNTPSNVFSLDCGAGNTITSIDQVVYGSSSGFCGAITPGSCVAPKAKAAVSAACLGKQSCVVAGSDAFMNGAAPCANPTTAVQVTCSGSAQHTYWNFTELDKLMADFMNATANHTNIINFSTPPTWLYQTPDRVGYPDDPLGETWSYEQGGALRDPTGKTFGDYYGRLLAWYTDGGFTDEYGAFHASGHAYNISTWEFLNEMEHGLSHELYTLEYDNMYLSMKAMAPIGTRAMKTMALASINMDSSWFSYIFNQSNHLPGVPLPDSASFHGYASCANRSDPASYVAFFQFVDDSLPSVAAIMDVRNTMNPAARIDLDESGVILPDDNDPVFTSADPGFPNVYWNAAASYYMYTFARFATVGLDVLGMSQFVGYPNLVAEWGANYGPQYPSVSMTNWTDGSGTARYWILKLMLEQTEVGSSMMNTTVELDPSNQTGTNPFCGSILNLQTLNLQCAGDGTINDITFASYGTPTGSCPTWTVNASCNSPNSLDVVKAACLGQNSCSVVAGPPNFGDPCFDTVKNLTVVATCTGSGGYQPTGGSSTYGQGLLSADGTRRVLIMNKSPTLQSMTVPGATGGSWAYVDESTGFGPWATVTLTSDTFDLAPYAAGILTLA